MTGASRSKSARIGHGTSGLLSAPEFIVEALSGVYRSDQVKFRRQKQTKPPFPHEANSRRSGSSTLETLPRVTECLSAAGGFECREFTLQ